MVTALLLALVSQAADSGDATRITLKGRCDYSAAMPAPEPGELRIFCDSVVIAAGGSSDERRIEFSRSSTGKAFGFVGSMAGDRMMIRQIYLQPGVATAGTGSCRVFYRNADISAVSCVAKVRTRTYVTNFIPASR